MIYVNRRGQILFEYDTQMNDGGYWVVNYKKHYTGEISLKDEYCEEFENFGDAVTKSFTIRVGEEFVKYQKAIETLYQELSDCTEIEKLNIADDYYYVNDCGHIRKDMWLDNSVNNFRHRNGNCFKTEEEAKRHLQYLQDHLQTK